MIDNIGPIIAWVLFYTSIVSLILFAFGNAAKRADEAADDLADRIPHGDVRTADLISSSHPGQQ